MQKLIPLVKEITQIIQKSTLSLELKLPMIAVVGSQSSGKSSLLQAIIGKQFLPKGKGIVTRRPIQLHITRTQDQQYAQLFDKRDQRIRDFSSLTKIIDTETQKECGTNKSVSDVPLRIKIFVKNVLDLILVDLPGITKIPVGDQPKDIELIVTNLIKKYVLSANCLILAVSKATNDISVSQSLKLAYQCDPKGQRTIGVITYMDMVQQSHDILREVANLSRPIALGVVGVCMNPRYKVGEQQLKFQRQMFQNHMLYKQYSEKMGVVYLVKTLNCQLIKQIKKTLPEIREKIIFLLQEKEMIRRQLGQYQPINDKAAQGIIVLNLLSKFVRQFNDLLDGKSLQTTDELIGGARIQYIFTNVFRKRILEMNPFDFLRDEDIRIAIKNANGMSKSLFIPEVAFQTLLRQQIGRLEMPSLDCSRLIHQQLRKILGLISLPQLQRFQNLQRLIQEVMQKLLRESLLKTQCMIENLIEIQLGYINTTHPDFQDTMAVMQQHREDIIDKQQSSEKSQFLQKSNIMKRNLAINSIFPQDSIQKLEFKLNGLKRQKREDQDPDHARKNVDTHSHFSLMSRIFVSKLPKYELPQVPNRIRPQGKSKRRQSTQVQLIKHLIFSYFNVVKKNVNDMVPKSIVTFLVNNVRYNSQKMLVNSLYKQDNLQNLLHENEFNVRSRDNNKKQIAVLKNCLSVLAKVESRIC